MTSFDKHLDKIRKARALVEQAVAPLEAARAYNGKILGVVREMYFDHLCKCCVEVPHMENVDDASEVAARTVKTAQLIMEMGENFDKDANTAAASTGLPPETRDELERDLNMLG